MTGGERRKTGGESPGWPHRARELGMRALAILLSLSILTSNLVLVSAASTPPGQPSLLSPPNGAYLNDNTPTFEWTPGVGADYHRLLVDNDPDFSSPIYDNSSLTGNTLTLPPENALPDGTYYWKVVAVSVGGENSSESWSFTVDTLPPPFVNLLFPTDDNVLRESRPTFRWGRVADSSGVSYSLLVDNDPGCGTPELYKENLTENSYTPADNESLPAGRWYWRVLARDGAGNVSSSDTWSFFLDFSPPYATDWKITKVIGGEESFFPFAEGEYTSDNTPFLTFRLTDDASGVADNLRVLLDENEVSFTYHPEDGWVEHQVPPENALTEGTHTVKVKVWDTLGNYAEISRSFRVDLTPPPRAPLRSPEDYSSLNDPTPLFRWYDVPDNQVGYTLEVDDNLDFLPPIFRVILTATEFELPPENALPQDGWYYWRVRARDGGGNESVSEVWRFLLDTTPPSPPPLLSPENGEIVGENTPLFTWSSVPDAARYRLQLSPNPLFSPLLYDNPNLTETRDNFATHPENALPEGVYYWRVGALDNVGNLAWSQVRWFRVDLYPPEGAPVPLTPFNGIHTNNCTPTFSWTPVEDPAGVTYQLHLSTDENFSEPTIAENLVETSYTFGTPFQDGTYYWRVRAVDNFGHLGPFSQTFSFTVDTTVPAPQLVVPENDALLVNLSSIELDWWDVQDPAGIRWYRLEIDDEENFASPQLSVLLTSSGYTCPLPEGLWYWRVRVKDNTYHENEELAGNENVSEVRRFRVFFDKYVEPATLLYPADRSFLNDNTPLFRWSTVRDNFEPVTYTLTLYKGAGLENIWEEDTQETQLECGKELLDNVYYWQVITSDALGNKNYSPLWSFTVDTKPPSSTPPPYYAILVGIGGEVSISGEIYAENYDSTPQWDNSERIRNAPDDNYAFTRMENENQSYCIEGYGFRTLTGEITSVKIKAELHVENSFDDDYLVLCYYINGECGPSKKRWIPTNTSDDVVEEDITKDKIKWTWDNISSLRVRLESDFTGPADNKAVYVDALYVEVGWRRGTGESDVHLLAENLLEYPNWKPERIVRLTGTDATKTNIQSAFQNWSPLPDGAHFLFYFSGPGGVDYIKLYGGDLSESELRDYLYNLSLIPGSSLHNDVFRMLIFDSDYSGSLTDLYDVYGGPLCSVLTSTSNNENANLGVFSRFLREGMWSTCYPHVGPADNDNNFRITMGELFAYAEPKTAGQHPENEGKMEYILVGYFPPTPEKPIGPTNDTTPAFEWTPCYDPAGVRYLLEVDNDGNFPHPRRYENLYETSFTIPDELEDGTYYWRVKAIDLSGTGNAGPWSDVVSFTVDTVPPPAPSLTSPGNGTLTNDNTPTFAWATVTDPSGILHYELNYARDPIFTENLQIVLCNPLYNPPYTLPSDKALPDGTWYWRVRARDGAGNWGEWSEVWTFTVDTSPPPIPSLLLPPNGSILDTSTPTFRWTSVTDPSGVTYRLVVDNDPDFSSPIYDNSSLTENSLTLPPENALPDGTYYWRICARDNAGNQTWSGSWSFTVDISPPGKPLPLSPENGSYINDNTPSLRWTRVVDPSGVLYDLELDDDNTLSSPLLSCYGLPENELELENALPDGTYYWRVRARDGWGRGGEWSVAFFTVDTQPPTGVVLLCSPQPGENFRSPPTFSWMGVDDAAKYEIWIDNNLDFSSPEWKENCENTTYTLPHMLPDGVYYWKVRAHDAAGNVGLYWSDVWSFRIDTLVFRPSLLSPENGKWENENAPTFSWTSVTDPSGVTYRLVVDNDPDFSSPIYDNSSLTENTLTLPPENALPDGTYYWKVQAKDIVGNENWSEIRKFGIDLTPPSSWVSSLLRPWENSPFTLGAENSPDNSGIVKVEFWYRYSEDNWNWEEWARFDEDHESPWSWYFTIPKGEGFYQFCARATDNAGNVEGISVEAECGVDTSPPPAPVLVSPPNNTYSRDNRPRFDWYSVPDLSGVVYDLELSGNLIENLENSEWVPPSQGLPENCYFWRVRARDSAGNWGEWSENRRLVIDPTPPQAPRLLSPENNANFETNTIIFRWEENSDNWVPGGYENYTLELYRRDNSLENTWTDLPDNFLEVQLTENDYHWRVRAFDRSGNASDWSENFYLWAYVKAPQLLSPENDAFLALSTPSFGWESVTDPSGVTYRLVVDNDPDFSSPIYDNSSITENSLTLPPENALDLAGRWYWRVCAVDGVDKENWETWSFTYGELGRPRLLSPDNNSVERDNTPTFYWENGENARGYRLVIARNENFSENVYDNSSLTENSLTLPQENSLQDGIYYWKVYSLDSMGTENRSENIWVLTINTDFTLFFLLEPENGSFLNDNCPFFTWTKAEPEQGTADNYYHLQIDNDSDFSSPLYENLLTDNVDNFKLHPENSLADGLYYWRVRIEDNYRNVSEWCENVFTIDTSPPSGVWLLKPADGRYENERCPLFKWTGGFDANFEGYHIKVDNDSDFSSPLYENDYVCGTSLILPEENALDSAGPWYWRVGARDRAGNESWSETWSFIFDNQAPSSPVLSSPENGKSENRGTPTFSWSSVTDPSGVTYRLQVDNDPDFSSPIYDNSSLTENTLTLPPENALPDGTYYWKVCARDGAGNENWSENVWTLTVDTSPPPVPSLLSPLPNTLDNENTQTFVWSKVEEGAIYRFQLSLSPSFQPLYHENFSIEDNRYDYVFTESGVYYWRVRARDRAGNWGEWSENRRLVIDLTPPSAPKLLSPENSENLNTGCPIFKWQPVSDNSGVTYLLQVGTNPSSLSMNFTTPYSTFTLPPENRLPDNLYYWRVWTRDGAGNWSGPSSLFQFRIDTILLPPSLLEPDNHSFLSDNTPTFRWSEVDDNTTVTYHLQISPEENFENLFYSCSITENTLTLPPENALPDGTYYWKVVVKDGAGNENCSGTFILVVDTQVEAPQLYSPGNGSFLRENKPYFDWQTIIDRSGVTYTLIIDNDPELSSPIYCKPGLTYSEHTCENALPDGTYYWAVRVEDGVGNQSLSENRRFVIDTVAPLTPENLQPPENYFSNTNLPSFGWSEVENADYYELQLARDRAFTQQLRTERCDENFCQLSQPLGEGTWYWRARALDNAGNSSSWSENRKLVVDTKVLSPKLLSPASGSYLNDNTPAFSWENVEDPSGVYYELQVSQEPTFASKILVVPARLYAENAGGENVSSPENACGPSDENYASLTPPFTLWVENFLKGEGRLETVKLRVSYRVEGNPQDDNLVLTYSLNKGENFGSSLRWIPQDNGEKELDVTGDVEWWWENLSKLRIYLRYENHGGVDGFTVLVDSLYLVCTFTSFTPTAENALPDGTYYWRVVVKDGAGTGNENCSENRWLLIDTVPPGKPTLVGPSGVMKDNSCPSLEWLGIPDASGTLYQLEVYLENDLLEAKSGLVFSEAQVSLLKEGRYRWRVRALDRAGNEGEWSDNMTFILDLLPPTPENGYLHFLLFEENENRREDRYALPTGVLHVNDNTPRLWLVLRDNGTGILDFSLRLDNENTFSHPTLLGADSLYLENRDGAHLAVKIENLLPELPEGAYWVELQTGDNIPETKGGPHTQVLTWCFVVDITPPENAPEWKGGSWYSTPTPTFSWTEILDVGGNKVWRYELWIVKDNVWDDNHTVYRNNSIYDNVVCDNTVSHTVGTNLQDYGNYHRRVRGIDNAGNAGPWSEAEWFGIDTQRPSSYVNPVGTKTSSPFAITATASDTGSGVVSVELFYAWSSDNSSWGSNKSSGLDNTPPWSWSFTAPDGPGYYRFYSKARDSAGNEQIQYSYTYGYLQLQAPDFSLSVSPSSGSAQQGGSATATVSVQFVGGYDQTVTLSSSGAPEGMSVSFDPSSGSSTFSSTMTVTVGSGVQAGTYTITVTGTGGDGKSHSASYALTVTTPPAPDFSLSVSPSSGSAQQGGSATATVSVQFVGGYDQTVTLSSSGAPEGMSVSFDPSSGSSTFSSTMTVTVGSGVQAGTYTITVTGTGADGKSHSASYALTVSLVQDFTISVNPGGATLQAGSSTTATVSVQFVGGYNKTVSLSSEAPSGISVSFDPSSGSSTFSSTMTVTVGSGVQAGTYTITVTGTGGDGKSHSNPYVLTVTVPDFSLSVSPSSGSAQQGGSATATVSVQFVGGYDQTVTLSSSGAPEGMSVSFDPSSGSSTFSSTMTVTVGSGVQAGTYTITVTGTGADGKSHSASYALTVTAPSAGGKGLPVTALGGVGAAMGILVMVLLLIKRIRGIPEEWM